MSDLLFDYGREVTFEDDLRELEIVETLLGIKLGLPPTPPILIRSHLARLAGAGMLKECALVADWHGLYANHVDWLEHPESRKFQ